MINKKLIRYLPCLLVTITFIFSVNSARVTTIAKSAKPSNWSTTSAEIDGHLLIIKEVKDDVVYYVDYEPNGLLSEGDSRTAPKYYRAYLQYVLDNYEK